MDVAARQASCSHGHQTLGNLQVSPAHLGLNGWGQAFSTSPVC